MIEAFNKNINSDNPLAMLDVIALEVYPLKLYMKQLPYFDSSKGVVYLLLGDLESPNQQ